MPADSKANGSELRDFIQAYEAARAAGKTTDLAGFLPPPDHPLYPEVQRQLQALDLGYRVDQRPEPEEPFEQTVWANGNLGTPKQESPLAADREQTTARILVKVQ